MQSSSIKSIRQTLASGQTEAALQKLMELAEACNTETHQSAILLRAAWEHQEQAAINGALSFEEANQQRNRIIEGALRLLTDLESDGQISNPVQAGLRNELYNTETAALMQVFDNDKTNLSGAKIHADDGASVIIGEGNTVHKKTYHALGIRQFIMIFIGLIALGAGGYMVYNKLVKGQSESYTSLREIQKEMGVLADLNKDLAQKLQKDRAEIDNLLSKGLKAMQEKDYTTAVIYLEKVAETIPASGIYQNLAYAYEQLGQRDKAADNRNKANVSNPATIQPNTNVIDNPINLLASENGGKIVASTNEETHRFTDGKLEPFTDTGSFGIYSFKDGKSATFNQFQTYVPRSSCCGQQEIELLFGNESPTGNFTSIGKFKTFNGRLEDQLFQTYDFPAVTAKYFKFVSKYKEGVCEYQLIGTLSSK